MTETLQQNWLSKTLAVCERLAMSPSEPYDLEIDWALRELGNLARVDRAYLFHADHDRQVVSNTHEWCAAGVNMQLKLLKDQPIADYGALVDPLIGGEMVSISDVERMPPARAHEQAILNGLEIVGLLLVPLGHPLRWFIGFDAVRAPIYWEREHEIMLQMVGQVIAARLGDAVLTDQDDGEDEALRRIMDSMPHTIMLIDQSPARVRFVNANYQDLFNRRPDTLVEDPADWLRAVHPIDRPSVLATVAKPRTTPTELRYHLKPPNTPQRAVEHQVFPVVGSPNSAVHLIREVRDVESPEDLLPREDTREALRAEVERLLEENAELHTMQRITHDSASMFRDLAERAEAAILVVSNGRVLYANPAARRLTGRSERELTRIPLAQIFGTAEGVRILKATREGYHSTLSVTRPDGELTSWSATVQPFQLSGVSATLIIGLDVSDHVSRQARIASELNDMTRLARSQLFAQLYARLAHELNQPLTAIVAFGFGAALQLEKAGADPEIIEIVRRMSAEGERAGQIVRELRSLFEQPKPELRLLTLDELIRRPTELMASELTRERIELRLVVSEGEQQVRGQPAQLELILLNLIQNAIDAISAQDTQRWLRVSGERRGERVIIDVVDPGTPIAKDIMNDIFEASLSAESDGHASTLYLCRRIAQQHGGELARIDDPQLKIFRLSLPIAEEDE